jgi:phage terminase Nu1 subunit (DNA packaging protein)
MSLSSGFLAGFDLDKPAPSQADFGVLVGLSQQHVSRLVAAGVLVEGASLREWIRAYTQRLRDTAADRARQSSPELQFERRQLLRARIEGLRMHNDARRAELAPVAVMAALLEKTGARIAPILGAIPPALRAQLPVLQSESACYAAIEATVAKAVGAVRGMRLADDDDGGDDGEAADD